MDGISEKLFVIKEQRRRQTSNKVKSEQSKRIVRIFTLQHADMPIQRKTPFKGRRHSKTETTDISNIMRKKSRKLLTR